MILLNDLPHAAHPTQLPVGSVLRRRGVQIAGMVVLDLSLLIRSHMLSQHLQRNRPWHLPGILLRLLGD